MASLPTCPPAQNINTSISNTGVAFIEYNINGSLLATRDDSTPSTVWIWSPQLPSAIAILIHHFPVKRVRWHPNIANLLLIQCNLVDPVIHLWNAAWEAPKVIRLPLDKLEGKIEANWLHDEAIDMHMLMLGNAHNYVIGQISRNGELASLPDEIEMTGAGPEDMFDEGNSLDLCQVSDEVDDTFRFRRQAESSI